MSTQQNTSTNAGGNQGGGGEGSSQDLKSQAARGPFAANTDALTPGRLVHKLREMRYAEIDRARGQGHNQCVHVYTITEHKHIGLMPLDEYELVPVSHAHGEPELLPRSRIIPLASPFCNNHIHCPNAPPNWDPQAINLPAHTGHLSTSDMESATQADFEEMPFADDEDSN